MKMTIFLTSSQGDEKGQAVVSWRTGLDKGGDVHVSIEDPALSGSRLLIAAELASVRYLILEKKIFGDGAAKGVGNGIDIVSTRGALKKVWFGKGETKDIAGYVFFKQRLPSMTIKIEKKVDTSIPNGVSRIIDHLKAKAMLYEVFDTVIGPVEITRHALEQYEERFNKINGEANNYLVSLLKHLRNTNIRQVSLPDNVVRHKIRKYGADDKAEHWNVPGSRWHYVFASSSERSEVRRMLTVYPINKNRM